MNARQRRVFRRSVDSLFPAGAEVSVLGHPALWRVRKRSRFERYEHTKVMIEKSVKPFGHRAVHYSDLRFNAEITGLSG